ncbi:hypothetical protein ACEPAG_2612 [Sanghuangporus baumii]
MTATRGQRQRDHNLLGWIDLDPWNTNEPPRVDDHQVIEPPEEQLQNHLPDVDNHQVFEPPEEQSPSPIFGNSPLTSLPTSSDMPPSRSRSRESRARSRSIRPLTVSHSTQPNNHIEAGDPSSSNRQPLDRRISSPFPHQRTVSPPVLLDRIQTPPQMETHQRSSAKRPEEYRIKDFDVNSKLKGDGSNYFLWKDLQEQILYGNCWFEHIDGSLARPDRLIEPDKWRLWHQVDNLAKGQLSFNMDNGLYQNLHGGITCAADLWKKLDARFGMENAMSQNKTIMELRNKRIGLTEAVKDHNFHLRKLKADVLDSGLNLSDKEWTSIVVASFGGHPKWEMVANMGSFFANGETILTALELHDLQNASPSSPHQTALTVSQTLAPHLSNSSALVGPARARHNNNRPLCPNCKRGYHSVQACWAPGGGSVDKRPPGYRVPTNLLHKERAHLASMRKDLEDKEKAMLATSSSNQLPQVAHVTTESSRQFMMAVSECHIESTSWLVDSGATSHFTNDRSIFIDYEPLNIEVGMPNLTGMVAVG